MDFNKIVATTITNLNKGYEKSFSELEDVIHRVEEAIKNNSDKNFGVFYRKLSEGPSGDVFRVFFDTNTHDPDAETIQIVTLYIPAKGYPIKIGTYKKITDDFVANAYIKDQQDLEKFFGDLLSNPDSALIQAIGFGMRKKATEENELPF